jgi:hypothetical protein
MFSAIRPTPSIHYLQGTKHELVGNAPFAQNLSKTAHPYGFQTAYGSKGSLFTRGKV